MYDERECRLWHVMGHVERQSQVSERNSSDPIQSEVVEGDCLMEVCERTGSEVLDLRVETS